MYLKSIELAGFKSFAKKSTLEFKTAITAVVGPNGSGKSNVAEAFRFVLGEQSLKSLRGKRGEDLIWNGAGSEPRANRASVRIIFDNSSKVFGIDFPEVAIERIVHRDGVNDYLVNGSQVRLKDVLELLTAAHVGASGHHIISQGEADKILNASPKERKSMIEDALGLKIYEYKRQESERKLEKTAANMKEVESLRREIAPHLKFLKKQVEKFEQAEAGRVELITLAKEYFKREELYLRQTKEALAHERRPIDARLVELAKESQAAKEVLALEADLETARAKEDEVARELGRIEGRIAAEEAVLERERRLAASDETKTVGLGELRKLLDEVKGLSSVSAVVERLGTFITERLHRTDSKAVAAAEREITTLSARRQELEVELEAARAKGREVSVAEKAVFRIKALESELVASLNALKSRQEALALDEAAYTRDLEETARLVGTEVLHFQNLIISDAETVEPRSIQEDRRRAIERLRFRLEDAGLTGAPETMKEYKETAERDSYLSRELVDLEQSAESLRELVADLGERLENDFSEGVEKINQEFGTLFSAMFGGGEARLSLIKEEATDEESEDDAIPAETGLDISVSLPRKKIRSLQMLSGGERALTSIALLFAVSAVNPPPFIILDETDAALDEANSKRYGDMVEMLSKHSQLILITHNRETMSRAGVIYGVTMGSTGVSKLLSIAFEEAVQVAK